MFRFTPERPADADPVETLFALALGPRRTALSA